MARFSWFYCNREAADYFPHTHFMNFLTMYKNGWMLLCLCLIEIRRLDINRFYGCIHFLFASWHLSLINFFVQHPSHIQLSFASWSGLGISGLKMLLDQDSHQFQLAQLTSGDDRSCNPSQSGRSVLLCLNHICRTKKDRCLEHAFLILSSKNCLPFLQIKPHFYLFLLAKGK